MGPCCSPQGDRGRKRGKTERGKHSCLRDWAWALSSRALSAAQPIILETARSLAFENPSPSLSIPASLDVPVCSCHDVSIPRKGQRGVVCSVSFYCQHLGYWAAQQYLKMGRWGAVHWRQHRESSRGHGISTCVPTCPLIALTLQGGWTGSSRN